MDWYHFIAQKRDTSVWHALGCSPMHRDFSAHWASCARTLWKGLSAVIVWCSKLSIHWCNPRKHFLPNFMVRNKRIILHSYHSTLNFMDYETNLSNLPALPFKEGTTPDNWLITWVMCRSKFICLYYTQQFPLALCSNEYTAMLRNYACIRNN